MTNKEEKPVDKKPELRPLDVPTAPGMNKFTLLIAIISLGIAIWVHVSSDRTQKKWMHERKSILSEVDQLKQEQQNNLEQIVQQKNSAKETQATLQNKINQLNQELQTSIKQKNYQSQDWLLLKARYYLELAQVNAYWNADFNTAIALLVQSDTLLEQLYTPKVFELRQAIAKEIALLKSIPAIDRSGLLSRLDALQSQVDNLHNQSILNNKEALTQEAQSAESKQPVNWRGQLVNNLSSLKNLVIIRRDKEQIKPLISPLFESILKENIRLNLQEAQWAILNNDSKVYQLALQQAIKNIDRAFNKNSSETVALLKQLHELQQAKITHEKPKMDLALPLLDALIHQGGLDNHSMNQDKKGEN